MCGDEAIHHSRYILCSIEIFATLSKSDNGRQLLVDDRYHQMKF